MNLVKNGAAALAALVVSMGPAFAAKATPAHATPSHGGGVSHPVVSHGPHLVPILCQLGDGIFDEGFTNYVNDHGKFSLEFGIVDDGDIGFGDVGVGAFVDGVQGTGFNSMVLDLVGFDANFSLGPIIYLSYVDVNVDGGICFFAGSLAELGTPRPVRRGEVNEFKFTFTTANMLSLCALFDGSNFPFVPAGAIIDELAIGTVTPGNDFRIKSVVVNNKNVLINPHVAENECDIFFDAAI